MRRGLTVGGVDSRLLVGPPGPREGEQEGPAVLDLGGHVLERVGSNGDQRVPQAGIHVRGSGATVRNGIVRGCVEGVVVEGEGKHLLSGVTALASRERGIKRRSAPS